MKKIIWACVLVLLFVCVADVVKAQTTKLKILSWNIYMLPRHIKHTGKLPRASIIGKMLKDSDYDIIVFQEAFHGGARRRIKRATKEVFPHRIGPANRHYFWFKTNSGIWILSRIPLKKLGTVEFKECEGPDCWANKGALLVQGEKDGKQFQILGTHLEAGGPQTIRDSQYTQIGELLDKNAVDGIPQFICGDFNTRNIDTLNYQRMLSAMKATDSLPHMGKPGDDLVNHFRNKDKSKFHIDYIFCRDNKCATPKIRREIKVFRALWRKPENQDLSDHFAVEAEVVF
ncbi:MAG: endonuclease/exonuclease/phosphatase family protein [Sphingobacteriales bacterium JAD_PAG50586_3]|nr:MAG: endonuclease/exonuclease/phosphatase family protein [Sphingobacteriales bacterium JAD_PAG50586_3]